MRRRGRLQCYVFCLSVCHAPEPYFSRKSPGFPLREATCFRRLDRRSASFPPTEAWLSSSVTDARIAFLDSTRTQLSARGWRFQEKGTLLPFYEQKCTNGGDPPPHAPLHTHPHTSIHARTPNPHTQPPAAAHIHTYGRIRRQADGRRACPAGDLPHGGRLAWGLRRTRNVELAPETRHDRFNQVENVKTASGDVWKLQTVCAVPRNRYSDTQT